jgi:hypothetical protein
MLLAPKLLEIGQVIASPIQQQAHHKISSLSPSSSSSSVSPSCMSAAYNFNLIDYNNESLIQNYFYNSQNHHYQPHQQHHSHNNSLSQLPNVNMVTKKDSYVQKHSNANSRNHPYSPCSHYQEDASHPAHHMMPVAYHQSHNQQQPVQFYAHSNIYYQYPQQNFQPNSIEYLSANQQNSFYAANHADDFVNSGYEQSYDIGVYGHRSRSTATKTTVNTKPAAKSPPKTHKRSQPPKQVPSQSKPQKTKNEKRAMTDETATSPPPPKKRFTANRKERRRTQSINNAFSDLRNSIPHVPVDTKLSKIKTLKLATKYIEYLMDVLEQNDPVLLSGGFKPDLGKLRRECRSREIKASHIDWHLRRANGFSLNFLSF